MSITSLNDTKWHLKLSSQQSSVCLHSGVIVEVLSAVLVLGSMKYSHRHSEQMKCLKGC